MRRWQQVYWACLVLLICFNLMGLYDAWINSRSGTHTPLEHSQTVSGKKTVASNNFQDGFESIKAAALQQGDDTTGTNIHFVGTNDIQSGTRAETGSKCGDAEGIEGVQCNVGTEDEEEWDTMSGEAGNKSMNDVISNLTENLASYNSSAGHSKPESMTDNWFLYDDYDDSPVNSSINSSSEDLNDQQDQSHDPNSLPKKLIHKNTSLSPLPEIQINTTAKVIKDMNSPLLKIERAHYLLQPSYGALLTTLTANLSSYPQQVCI